LSIRDLATQVGITPKTLTDLEYGRRRASYHSIRQISSVLGVPPTEISEFAATLSARGILPTPPPRATDDCGPL
jgi:transcriptional regulator with XRE-family HTH domain